MKRESSSWSKRQLLFFTVSHGSAIGFRKIRPTIADITITDKSSNSHRDIPADSNLFLQLILDGNNHLDLELQRLGEHLYKECPDSNDPDHGDALNSIEIRACISHVFIAVCRSSQIRGNRLLGWMIIHQADLKQTSSGEWCILATNVQVMNYPGFCATFKTVNADGPCLELSASVSASLAESDVGHSEQIAPMPYSSLARPDLLTIDVLFAEGDQLRGILKDSGNLDSTSIFILYEKILLLPSSPSRGLLFKILGSTHFQHYINTKAMADLNQAVSLYHDADRDIPWNHKSKFDSLSSLAYVLSVRFEHLSQLSDINEAISAVQAAVELVADDHAEKPTLLSSLGGYFRDRYERFGALEDINASISNRELALQLTPDGDPSMSSRLHGHASVLSIRFQHTADPKDSDGAILKMKAAIQLISEQQSEDLPGALEALGLALLARFERLGDQNNINESVSTLQTAVSMTPDEDRRLPRLLNALASSRGRRFIDSGDIVDIDTSITLLERAIQLSPPRDVFLPSYLRTLGETLLARFEHFGEVNDINNAIIQAEAAVNLTSNGDHAKPSRLSSLADALSSRFERFGNLHDLNNAIACQETAVSLTPHSHASMPGRLHNLAQCLDMRFSLLGDLTDLNNCISRAEAAMQLIPHFHVDKPLHMKSLGLILYQRFSRLESRKDIDDAILITDAAIRLLPDNDTSRYQYLGNLANFLAVRSQTFGEKLDVHRAITLTEEAVQLVPEGHPSKAHLINDLGTNIGLRFDHFGNLEDLNNSLSLIEKSIQLIPSDHFNHPRFCLSLGYAVLKLMQHLEDHDQELDPQIFDRLASAFSTAAQSVVGSSSTRFTAASIWARSAHRLLSPPSLEGYMTAMRLLPELVWLGLSISDRHHHLLGNATQLVRDAVAAAIEAGEHEKAVEWFEQGQSIIWSQILELRQPVEELERAYPDLAHRLVELSKRLDSSSDDQIAVRSKTVSASQFPKLNQHHKIAQDREELLQKIRSLNGFETFLSPPTLTGVAHSARGRTLVMLNVHNSRCDALVLKDDHVFLVPLDGLTYEHARKMQETLNLLLVNSGSRLHLDRISDYDDGIADPQSKFKRILAELWVCIAKPILNGLGISVNLVDHHRSTHSLTLCSASI